jgi:8-oxo-dGTP pyrophosphatase MutT (NUDIX family)
MKPNPWKRLSSREIYRNPWMALREDRVIRPDGQEGIYGVVETRIATAVVALTPEQHVYLVGQYRYTVDAYSWEVIEGGADLGEDPLDTARRELREEAGLIASDWTRLGPEVHLSNCISSEIGYCYLAEGLSDTDSEPDGTELLEVRRMPFREALAMAGSGEIKDAMSIIALYRADRYLRTR